MSEKVTYVRLTWAGGEHRFQIDLSSEFSLYRIPDPFARLQRLLLGQWSAEDVYGTIRRGLHLPHHEVEELFARHCRDRPIGELVPLAQTILGVAIFGIDKAIADQGLEPEQVKVHEGDGDE